MKQNFYVSAIYASPPNTMGGNTKILLEMINNLYKKYEFTIFTTEPDTFKKNVKNIDQVKLVDIKSPYSKFSLLNHKKEIDYVNNFFNEYFFKKKITSNDFFYSCSDFAPDVLPIYYLKSKYSFKWVASLFLFIPNPIENLRQNYEFPFFKYIIYFTYQQYLFKKILEKANYVFVTNDVDRKYFNNFDQNKIHAIYGGVNTEQVIKAVKNNKKEIKYDAIFCSRLHPQKGISKLLDIWALVIKKIPKAKLAIIGNGDQAYEEYLKKKAEKLQLNANLIWFGYVNNIDKYKLYMQSKIFIHSTVYDNNGMVASEALCTGLPVFIFNLDSFKRLYNEGCVKIPRYNLDIFANRISFYLRNNKYRKIIPSKKLVEKLRRRWSWKRISKNIDLFLIK